MGQEWYKNCFIKCTPTLMLRKLNLPFWLDRYNLCKHRAFFGPWLIFLQKINNLIFNECLATVTIIVLCLFIHMNLA